MKKTISVFLSVLVLLSCIGLAFSAGAMSASKGTDALRTQFKSGEAALDYVYYEPTKKNAAGIKGSTSMQAEEDVIFEMPTV